MSKFMNGLNNDIPSPVEEGVVDWFKKKIGKSEDNQKVSSEEIRVFKNVASVIDIKLLNETLKKFDAVIKKVLNRPEYSQLKRGFYKVNPNNWWIGKSRYEELSTGIGFFKNNLLPNQKYWIGVYGIRYNKIFKGKEYLDLSPEAERGDTSEYGKAFWNLAKKFENDVLDTDFGKIPGFNGIDFDSINDWDDDPEVQIAIIIDQSKLVSKEAAKESAMEAAQEELFPILTGKELPVNEMSDNAAEALAVASAIGLVGLGMGLFSLVNKGIDKLFGNKKSSGSTKINRKSADTLKKLGKEFMDTQTIDSNERRNAYNDAIKLLKQYYPKEYVKKHFGISLIGGEWNEPSDFYKGKINICDFAFIHSASQDIPGYEEIRKKNLPDDEDEEQREIARNKYHKTIREMLNSINKDLTKKYKGKYRVYCEEFDDYWDIYGEGDGDEGVLIIADVDIINRMKSYIGNHATKESTEIATEGISNGALAAGIIGAFWGTAAIGYGLYKILNPEPTYYDKPSQISPIAKAKMDKIKELEEASKEFMKTQNVDSSERRKVVAEAISLVKKHYPKDLDKRYDFAQEFGEYGSDAEDFYKGNCNLLSIGHTPSKWQEFPGSYELDLDTPAYERAQKYWSTTIAKCEAAVNKDLSKKYKGKYKVFFEEVEKGGWWEYCWTGDGDEGLVIVVDVDMINKLKDYIKNKSSVKESTEVIYEGCGVAFTRFAVKHNLPFANKLEDKIWEWSESTVNQLTNIPEFKEYILREAPKAYDEAYLRNNNLSINVNADMISEFEEEYEDSEAYHKVDKKNCCFCKKIGKFYVGVFGDKSHIHGVWLLMSDSKNKKIYAKALPAPEKELNKFKYQK